MIARPIKRLEKSRAAGAVTRTRPDRCVVARRIETRKRILGRGGFGNSLPEPRQGLRNASLRRSDDSHRKRHYRSRKNSLKPPVNTHFNPETSLNPKRQA
ncbi:MAG: hypothetical protein KDJ82_06930, partial [Rhodobacteraceae bacterium]|nr:hypothetical protein [Paracoccaceae bacterium]